MFSLISMVGIPSSKAHRLCEKVRKQLPEQRIFTKLCTFKIRLYFKLREENIETPKTLFPSPLCFLTIIVFEFSHQIFLQIQKEQLISVNSEEFQRLSVILQTFTTIENIVLLLLVP